MSNTISALDMHIGVLQGLQKVDGFTQDIFSPEEIDFHLNKQQLRFVEELVNNQFQEQQVFLDNIDRLVVKDLVLPAFDNTAQIPSSLTKQSNEPKVFSFLPSDYMHRINSRARVAQLKSPCSASTLSTLAESVEESIITVAFPIETIDGPTSSYLIDFTISVDGTEVYKSSFNIDDGDLSQGSIINNLKDTTYIINDILENIDVSGIAGLDNRRIYWEQYKDLKVSKSFIFVKDLSQDAFPTAITATTKESTGAAKTTVNGVVYDSPKTFTRMNNTAIAASTEFIVTEADIKVMPLNELYELAKNIFYKPSPLEPQGYMANGVLGVLGSTGSLITSVVLDYVMKPRQISLALDKGCELNEAGSRKIVDYTVEYLKLIIENQSYQGVLQDNQLKNQNALRNG